MWLFTKSGHLRLAQHVTQPDLLIIQARHQQDMSRFVGLLDDASSDPHNVQETGDGSYQGTVAAAKLKATQAVVRMADEIDYRHFVGGNQWTRTLLCRAAVCPHPRDPRRADLTE